MSGYPSSGPFALIDGGRAVSVTILLPAKVIAYLDRQPWRAQLDDQIEATFGVASFALHCADARLRAHGIEAARQKWSRLKPHAYFRGSRLLPFTLRFRPGSRAKWEAIAAAAGISVDKLLRGAVGERYSAALEADVFRRRASSYPLTTKAA